MAWRRASDDGGVHEFAGEPGDQPGGPAENPVCERCDQLLRADSCEQA